MRAGAGEELQLFKFFKNFWKQEAAPALTGLRRLKKENKFAIQGSKKEMKDEMQEYIC